MFLAGPFLKLPFLDPGIGVTRAALTAAGSATATFHAGTTFKAAGSSTVNFIGTAGAVLSAAGSASVNFRGSPAAVWHASGSATATFIASGGARLFVTGQSTAGFVGSTAWDVMLEEDLAPIAYFVELEPWVLADRS